MNVLKQSTLRPGLLVGLKTSVVGNVSYEKKELEAEHIEEGAAVARWETERTIVDPVEFEQAKKVRTKARSLVTGVCAHSAFGLLCPEDKADALEAAVVAAQQVASEFNASAKLSRVNVYVMTGRIAPDDEAAIKAINSEVRELLATMEDGLSKLDVKKVREAASRAKSLGSMLSSDAEARIRIAIDAARESATKIVKAGTDVAQEIDRSTINRLKEARYAFLDLDVPSVDTGGLVQESRTLDLAPAGVN